MEKAEKALKSRKRILDTRMEELVQEIADLRAELVLVVAENEDYDKAIKKLGKK